MFEPQVMLQVQCDRVIFVSATHESVISTVSSQVICLVICTNMSLFGNMYYNTYVCNMCITLILVS